MSDIEEVRALGYPVSYRQGPDESAKGLNKGKGYGIGKQTGYDPLYPEGYEDPEVPDSLTCHCGAVWTNPEYTHCAQCHRLFADVEAYGRHKDRAKCPRDLRACKLVQDQGLWRALRRSGNA